MSTTLSPREIELCRWLMLDLHNGEIAQRMGISTGTLRTYLGRCLFKTGTRSRLGLALWAAKNVSAKVRTQVGGHARRTQAA